ncbi:MAG: TetR/AcrR family transcriptional regulator [Gammaproteobacteria bacterium]
MADWPTETTLAAFRRAWKLEGEPFWTSVFDMHKDKIQIKNPKVAIGNLEKIFSATFKLANGKGFQAMSLRDLSRETGISMGGLYAYIGSKNDLASVIEGVLRQYIDQVIGELVNQDLEPVERLRAIVYGEIFMMQLLNPWYYFCYMELKGLDKEQQQQALDLELRFDSILVDAIQAGVAKGEFSCEKPALLASSITAQLQQWHLKHWKFRLQEVGMEEYAAYIIDNALRCLSYSPAAPQS